MDKHVFFFQDENLSAEKAKQGALKIIVGVDGMALLAVGASHEVLALESILFQEKNIDDHNGDTVIRETISGHKLLSYPFGAVQAAIAVPMATLVPRRLFSPDECSKYFHLLQPDKKNYVFAHEPVDAFGCHLVWAAAPCFQTYIDRFNPRHLAGVLIQQYRALASPESYSIFLNVRSNQAQITVFDLRNLVFYNTFEFNKPADLLYFVLLVYDQFRLNPEQVPLQISGALLEGTEQYKILFKYIQILDFIAPNALPVLPAGEKALPAHYWFDLLSL